MEKEHTAAIETSILGLLGDIRTHDGLKTLGDVIIRTYFFMNHWEIWKAYDQAFRKLNEGLDPLFTENGKEVLEKLRHESGVRKPKEETMPKEAVCCAQSSTIDSVVDEIEMPRRGF